MMTGDYSFSECWGIILVAQAMSKGFNYLCQRELMSPMYRNLEAGKHVIPLINNISKRQLNNQMPSEMPNGYSLLEHMTKHVFYVFRDINALPSTHYYHNILDAKYSMYS